MPCKKSSKVPLPATETARRGAGPTWIVSRLLRPRSGDFHRAAAALAVLADVGGELVGRAADHVVAFFDQLLLPEFRFFEHTLYIGVNPGNRIGRGSGRQEEPEPGVGLDLRIAEFGERRDFRQQRRAL